MQDSSLIQLMWLASPALPVGGFSYSECLESAVEITLAATESEASNWLPDQLEMSLARSDLAILAQAIPAWQVSDAPLRDGLLTYAFDWAENMVIATVLIFLQT